MNKTVFACFLFLLVACHIDEHQLPDGFIYLHQVAPDIEVELRYFSSYNFVGDTIDGYFGNRCIITKQAAKALLGAHTELQTKGLGLKVFDAYRPQRAVDHFVRWAKDVNDIKMKRQFYPNVDKSVLFKEGYISERSGHTRGSTVDLTIIYLEGNQRGQELDMGTSWDFFGPQSWPGSNDVTKAQKANRMLLQRLMMKHGFRPLKEEWWHFTLLNEPFPDTYFNFSVH